MCALSVVNLAEGERERRIFKQLFLIQIKIKKKTFYLRIMGICVACIAQVNDCVYTP